MKLFARKTKKNLCYFGHNVYCEVFDLYLRWRYTDNTNKITNLITIKKHLVERLKNIASMFGAKSNFGWSIFLLNKYWVNACCDFMARHIKWFIVMSDVIIYVDCMRISHIIRFTFIKFVLNSTKLECVFSYAVER